MRYRTHIDAGMPRRFENERNQAFGMFMVGATKQHIANAFDCHDCYASCTTSAFQRKSQPRQPSVTTRRRDQQVRVNHIRNRLLTSTQTRDRLWASWENAHMC